MGELRQPPNNRGKGGFKSSSSLNSKPLTLGANALQPQAGSSTAGQVDPGYQAAADAQARRAQFHAIDGGQAANNHSEPAAPQTSESGGGNMSTQQMSQPSARNANPVTNTPSTSNTTRNAANADQNMNSTAGRPATNTAGKPNANAMSSAAQPRMQTPGSRGSLATAAAKSTPIGRAAAALKKFRSNARNRPKNGSFIGAIIFIFILVTMGGLFSFNFPSFQLSTLVENATKYGMKRMLHTSSVRKGKILKYYFKERIMPGSSQADLGIQNYNNSLIGKLYSAIRDSDLERRLTQNGIQIRYGDPANPSRSNIVSIKYLDGSIIDGSNFEVQYDLSFQKAQARAHIMGIYNDLYHDESLLKRLAVRYRISRLTGTKWHWLDPITQPLKEARVKATNAVVSFIMTRASFFQRAAVWAIEQLTGKSLTGPAAEGAARDAGELALRDVATKVMSREIISAAESEVLTKALSEAVGGPVGLALFAVTVDCTIDKLMNGDYAEAFKHATEDKATRELVVFGSSILANYSQIKSGETNGIAVDAFIGGVLTNAAGEDWSLSNNIQRANGHVIPYTPTDDCTSRTEICVTKQPMLMSAASSLGRALLLAQALGQDGWFRTLLGIYIPGAQGGILMDKFCSIYSTINNTVGDVLSTVIKFAIQNSATYKLLDATGIVGWANGYLETWSKGLSNWTLTHIMLPPVVDGDTRGPAAGNAAVAAIIATANLTMRDQYGDAEGKTFGDPEAAKLGELSPEQAIALNQAANNDEAIAYRSLPLYQRLVTTNFAFAPMNRVITALPPNPTVAVDRFGTYLATIISPNAFLNGLGQIAQFVSNLTRPAQAVEVTYPELSVGIRPYGISEECAQSALPLADATKSGCKDIHGNDISMVKADTDNACSMLSGHVTASAMPSECGPQAASTGSASYNGKWLSGASALEGQETQFGTWRKSPTTIIGTWSDANAACQETQCALSGFDDWAGAVDNAIGGIYGSETWEQAATGAYDNRFKAALDKIRDHWGGKTTVFIRFAHEFNGDWYDWKVTKQNAAAFKQTWIRVYNLMKTELSGKDAKLVWSPNDGNHSDATAEEMWPGDQYVDVVGVDSYDWDPQRTTANFDAMANRGTIDNPEGIEIWRQFAEKHGKPISFPEWGTNPSQASDNPDFMTLMNQFFAKNAANGTAGAGKVAYDIIFNSWDTGRIYPNSPSVPNSAQRYTTLKWGN